MYCRSYGLSILPLFSDVVNSVRYYVPYEIESPLFLVSLPIFYLLVYTFKSLLILFRTLNFLSLLLNFHRKKRNTFFFQYKETKNYSYLEYATLVKNFPHYVLFLGILMVFFSVLTYKFFWFWFLFCN